MRFIKDILRVGTFTHPTAGWTLAVDHDMLSRLARNFDRMKTMGITVPITSDHKPSVHSTHGRVTSVGVDGDRLSAELELSEGGDRLVGTPGVEVSVEIDPRFASTSGERIGDAITALSLVIHPVVENQRPFERIAAGRLAASRAPLITLKEDEAMAYQFADDVGPIVSLSVGALADALGIDRRDFDRAAKHHSYENAHNKGIPNRTASGEGVLAAVIEFNSNRSARAQALMAEVDRLKSERGMLIEELGQNVVLGAIGRASKKIAASRYGDGDGSQAFASSQSKTTADFLEMSRAAAGVK